MSTYLFIINLVFASNILNLSIETSSNQKVLNEANKYEKSQKKCEMGNIKGCTALAEIEHAKGNFREALKYYIKACDEGEVGMFGCHGGASLIDNNFANYKRNIKLAYQLYEKACKGGVEIACYDLQFMVFNKNKKENRELMDIGNAIDELINFNEIFYKIWFHGRSTDLFHLSWSVSLIVIFVGLVSLVLAFKTPQRAHLFAAASILMSEFFVIYGGLFPATLPRSIINVTSYVFVGIQLVLFFCLVYFSKGITRIPAIIFLVFCFYSFIYSSLVGGLSLSGDNL